MPTIEASLLIEKHLAERLPKQPAWVQQVAASALDSMNELAGERGHKVTAAPRLVAQRDTSLGYVELTFSAETGPK